MSWSWKWELPQIAIVAAALAWGAFAYGRLPDSVPVHWNVRGEADGFGGPFEGAFGLPLVMLGMYVFLRGIPRLDPGRANYAQFQGAYGVIRIATLAILGSVYAMGQAWAFGHPVNMTTNIAMLVGALFVVLGGVLGKVRPNWFVGIRTPWTLSSKESWVKTHRLGGWLFVAGGLVSMAAGLALPAEWSVGVLLGSGLVVSLACVVYSWVVWRADPEKLPAAGTLPAE